MLFSTIHQGLLFLWMMAAGLCIGLWYALILGLRRLIQAGFWLTLSCDLLFGAGCAVILCAFLLAGSYGALRPFALLGAVCGAGICICAILPPLRYLGRWLARLRRSILERLSASRILRVLFK